MLKVSFVRLIDVKDLVSFAECSDTVARPRAMERVKKVFSDNDELSKLVDWQRSQIKIFIPLYKELVTSSNNC